MTKKRVIVIYDTKSRGIAFVEDGKLLIVQSHRSSQTNSWTFVGGGVEEGNRSCN